MLAELCCEIKTGSACLEAVIHKLLKSEIVITSSYAIFTYCRNWPFLSCIRCHFCV